MSDTEVRRAAMAWYQARRNLNQIPLASLPDAVLRLKKTKEDLEKACQRYAWEKGTKS